MNGACLIYHSNSLYLLSAGLHTEFGIAPHYGGYAKAPTFSIMVLECSLCMFKPFLHYNIWIGIAISYSCVSYRKNMGIDNRAFCMISLSPSYHLKEGIHIVQ